MQDLNIVEIIEQSPLSKLSNTCNNKLLVKIKDNFTNYEQQLFISNFYCYLNYDQNNEFIIDLDNIWKWIGFGQKDTAKRLMEKYLIENTDYKIFAPKFVGAKKEQRGGHNKEIIMMTINAFKRICLKAGTKKASEIHNYYLKIEDILTELMNEDAIELKYQLEQKNIIIQDIQQNSKIMLETAKIEKQKAVEKAIISQFPVNTECIYIGLIDNTNEECESLVKFGHSNDLGTRVSHHQHNSYTNFILLHAFKVQNRTEIENLIKSHSKIKKQLRKININKKNKTEIIAYNSFFTIDKLIYYIKEIIRLKTYSVENFDKLLLENDQLKISNERLSRENITLSLSNNELIIENKNIKETNEYLTENNKIIEQSVFQTDMEDTIVNKFHNFISKMCIVRSDVEESSVNMESQFRIWNREKPKKETFHAFKDYLDRRFKPLRVTMNGQLVHGYIGVKLIEIKHTKKFASPVPIETFIFQVCRFNPCGKMLNTTLLTEYRKWKNSVAIDSSDADLKEIKEYLDSLEYTLKATVWTTEGSNEGYYGIMLKTDNPPCKKTSSTGRVVEKRDLLSGILIGKWDTISKAAKYENISAAKMSRSVKNRTEYDNYYYCTA
jgi:hypothetical protein